MTERTVRWVWLSQCFSYGSGKLGKLLQAGVDPELFYEGGDDYRRSFGILNQQDIARIRAVSLDRAYQILDNCRKKNIWAVSWEDPDYPGGFRNIFDPPAVLYGKGDLGGLSETLRITVVGTRNCDDYTRRAAGNLSFHLAGAGVTIVSGCAVGIDEFALRGAVKARSRSIGILACGADVNYPAPNELLKENMLECGGALITELPPGTTVNRSYFPVRNRLMAGIAEGVFVVHAPLRSGALITAEMAVEQGKELFCLPPANIFSASYCGVVPYLRDGAKPVYSAEDILDEYEARWGNVLHKRTEPAAKQSLRVPEKVLAVADASGYHTRKPSVPVLSEQQKKVYALIPAEPLPVDEIIRISGMPAHQVLSVLTELELAGAVRVFPGRMYGRTESVNE